MHSSRMRIAHRLTIFRWGGGGLPTEGGLSAPWNYGKADLPPPRGQNDTHLWK